MNEWMERLAISKSFSYETNYSPDEIMTLCCSRLTQLGYQLNKMDNEIEAMDGRPGRKAVAAGLVPLSPGLAALYWFAPSKNRILVDVHMKGRFTITYEGKKAMLDALGLCNMLRSGNPPTTQPPSKKCPNCGADIVEGAIYCVNCGREI
jgi:hypothetical protein